jgi:hypothetical protein
MGAALEISTLDVRQPLIPLEEFYNEPLNETVGMLLSVFRIHMFLGPMDPDPLVRGMDPRIRIRIHTKISWIRNTDFFLVVTLFYFI